MTKRKVSVKSVHWLITSAKGILVQQYRDGYSIEQLAEHFNVSVATIREALKLVYNADEAQPENVRKGTHHLSAREEARLFRMYKEGATAEALSRRFNRTVQELNVIVNHLIRRSNR